MNILAYMIDFIIANFTFVQFENTLLAMTALIIVINMLFVKIAEQNKKDREREKAYFMHYIEEHSIQIKQFE